VEDTFFEPRYRISRTLLVLASTLPGLACVAACAGLGLGRHPVILALMVALLPPALLRIGHVRRIVFGENLIVVRFVFGDSYCNYQQVQRVDDSYFWTEKRRVYIGGWLNRKAFYEMVRALKGQGRLSHVALSGDAADRDV